VRGAVLLRILKDIEQLQKEFEDACLELDAASERYETALHALEAAESALVTQAWMGEE
jgi:hypothetical protein